MGTRFTGRDQLTGFFHRGAQGLLHKEMKTPFQYSQAGLSMQRMRQGDDDSVQIFIIKQILPASRKARHIKTLA